MWTCSLTGWSLSWLEIATLPSSPIPCLDWKKSAAAPKLMEHSGGPQLDWSTSNWPGCWKWMTKTVKKCSTNDENSSKSWLCWQWTCRALDFMEEVINHNDATRYHQIPDFLQGILTGSTWRHHFTPKNGCHPADSTQKHVVEDEAPRPSDTNHHQYAQKPTSKLTSQ